MRSGWADAAGMVAGYTLDCVFGDPRRYHPVAGFGRAAGALERLLYAPDRRSGAIFTIISVGVPVTLAIAAQSATTSRPRARFTLVTMATWAVLGGASLRREGRHMAVELENGDLAAARRRLPNLCGRDPRALGPDEVARATVESLAENTSDAVVGPLVWAALAGLPGLVGYRAVNTLDAMVGHRSERYRDFGTASARTDDVANLLPSRLTALLAAAAAPAVGGKAKRAVAIWRRDGGRHPSPNSGQCEAAFAGALGVRLGGTNVYFGRSESRPVLGEGRRPGPRDIRRSARLSALIGAGALVLAAVLRSRHG